MSMAAMPKRNTKSQIKLASPRKKRSTHFATLKKIAKRRSEETSWYHQLGFELNKVVSRDGSAARVIITAVAKEVFKNEHMVPTLYSARQFAKRISRTDLRKVKALSWGHIHYLISLQDLTDLDKLVQTVQEKRMTVRQFRLYVQDQNGGPRGGGKGRRRKPPDVSPRSALRELQRICREWSDLYDHFSELAQKAKRAERGKADEWQALQDKVAVALKLVRKQASNNSWLLG